jgi:hypothetical protein
MQEEAIEEEEEEEHSEEAPISMPNLKTRS